MSSCRPKVRQLLFQNKKRMNNLFANMFASLIYIYDYDASSISHKNCVIVVRKNKNKYCKTSRSRGNPRGYKLRLQLIKTILLIKSRFIIIIYDLTILHKHKIRLTSAAIIWAFHATHTQYSTSSYLFLVRAAL